FVFLGSKTEIARQIGNAVPPVFAQKIATYVLTLMEYQIQHGEFGVYGRRLPGVIRFYYRH
ncbi:hypothetical protein MJI37_06305, partial [Salmonella enterica subsp. enterica serovar Cerro]|nr:hypothetical protein [Salmonella enterica subsp. enterica serovar Cerro]